jgi:hypothetical protein
MQSEAMLKLKESLLKPRDNFAKCRLGGFYVCAPPPGPRNVTFLSASPLVYLGGKAQDKLTTKESSIIQFWCTSQKDSYGVLIRQL